MSELENFRNYVLEEAAKAAETAQISGSLMRPGIAKIIRSMKTTRSGDNSVSQIEQIEILIGALKMIISQDDTGEMIYEQTQSGAFQPVGRGKGKFAKIASLAIASSRNTCGKFKRGS